MATKFYQQWTVTTEPPTGRTQETFVCEVAERTETGRFGVFIERRDYRSDASYRLQGLEYSSGYRFQSRASAEQKALNLKSNYDCFEYKAEDEGSQSV